MRQQMNVTFLGTAAANAFPEAFCKCRNCVQARTLGGPSLRKRSAALINNDLLIDLGPDIMAAPHMHGCSLDQVRYCLQTHPHADHLELSHLLSRSPAYGVVGAPVLDFYAFRESLERAAETFERDLAGYRLLSPEAEKYLDFKIRQIHTASHKLKSFVHHRTLLPRHPHFPPKKEKSVTHVSGTICYLCFGSLTTGWNRCAICPILGLIRSSIRPGAFLTSRLP
jgi:ribonuclease BN (tRNA processing enzyme)